MAKSTPLSSSESIPISTTDLESLGARFLASATLCSGMIVGVFIDGNGTIVMIPTVGDPTTPIELHPRDLGLVADMFLNARNMLRQLVRDGA